MILDGEYGTNPSRTRFIRVTLQKNLALLPIEAVLTGLDDFRKPADIQIVENSAEMLYGLIHQRWIISRGGLQAMVPSFVFVTHRDRPKNTNSQHLDIVQEYIAIQRRSYRWADQIVKLLTLSSYFVHVAWTFTPLRNRVFTRSMVTPNMKLGC
jgi:Casein kinase II regulatory subunit